MTRSKAHAYFGFVVMLGLIMIFTGCNIDATEGLFRQISKSEPKVEVGSTTIIGIDAGNTKFSVLTSNSGLQIYDSSTKEWLDSPIRPTDDVNPVLFATMGSDGDLYFATRAYSGETNKLYSYDADDVMPTVSLESDAFTILQMDPVSGLMLATKTGSSGYEVWNVTDVSSSLTTNLSSGFSTSEYPWLLVQDADTFMISGKDSEGDEKHLLYDGGSLVGTITSIEQPVVAFWYDGTNHVYVDSEGTIHAGTSVDSLSPGDSISFYTNGVVGKPLPAFIINTRLWIQGTDAFHSISNDGTLASITDKFSINLLASSFKITSYIVDEGIVYGGTSDNGLFSIPDVEGSTVNWL